MADVHVVLLGKSDKHVKTLLNRKKLKVKGEPETRMVKIDEIRFITSNDYLENAKKLKVKFAKRGIPEEKIIIEDTIDPFSTNVGEIIRIIKDVKNSYSANDRIFTNITGGTNLMSCFLLLGSFICCCTPYYLLDPEFVDDSDELIQEIPKPNIIFPGSISPDQKNLLLCIYKLLEEKKSQDKKEIIESTSELANEFYELEINSKYNLINLEKEKDKHRSQRIKSHIKNLKSMGLINVNKDGKKDLISLTSLGEIIVSYLKLGSIPEIKKPRVIIDKEDFKTVQIMEHEELVGLEEEKKKYYGLPKEKRLNVHIATAGENPDPIIESFNYFRNNQKIDKLYMITSPNMKPNFEKVKSILNKTEIIEIDCFDYYSIIQAIVYLYYLENDNNIYCNITGGHNLLSSTACLISYFLGITGYYIKNPKFSTFKSPIFLVSSKYEILKLIDKKDIEAIRNIEKTDTGIMRKLAYKKNKLINLGLIQIDEEENPYLTDKGLLFKIITEGQNNLPKSWRIRISNKK